MEGVYVCTDEFGTAPDVTCGFESTCLHELPMLPEMRENQNECIFLDYLNLPSAREDARNDTGAGSQHVHNTLTIAQHSQINISSKQCTHNIVRGGFLSGKCTTKSNPQLC